MSRGCPDVDTSCYHVDGANCIILSDIRVSRDPVRTYPPEIREGQFGTVESGGKDRENVRFTKNITN